MAITKRTKEAVAHLLRKIIDPNAIMSDEENSLWEELHVVEPIRNNFIVTFPDGSQYNVQVKDVSGGR